MFSKGIFLETLLKEPNLIPMFAAKEGETLYSVTDDFFDPSSSFIFGTPSVHIFVRFQQKNFLILAYLDLKSTTFSFNPTECTLPLPNMLKDTFPGIVWDHLKVFQFFGFSLKSVLDDLHFFSGLNIYVLGYSTNNERDRNELETQIEGLQTIYKPEQAKKIAYGMLMLNVIAKESQTYQSQRTHYLIPSVSVEGLELWLGTNSEFFVYLCEGDLSDEKKLLMKFLFNVVFLRLCVKLGILYDIPFYTISKIERAFILEGQKKETLQRFLLSVKQFNLQALRFFKEELIPISTEFGKTLHNTIKKYQQVSTFYDEPNFVLLIILALTDESTEYKSLFDNLLHQNFPKLVTLLNDIIAHIDKAILSYLESERNEANESLRA